MEGFHEKVSIRELINYFHYRQITGNDESLNRWIVVPDVNRPGMELCGYKKLTEPRRLVIIGSKEMDYILEMSEEDQRERFLLFTDALTPMILITHGFECPPILKEVAESQNFPIFSSTNETYRDMVDIISFLDEKLAPSDNLHGVLMSVYGLGVLIMGASGMGKSEIALELIKRGHVLIADDRVDVSRVHRNIVGRPPFLLEGMLEIRGIGIIDVSKMYGASSILKKFNIDLIIKLEKFDDNAEYTRVGNEDTLYTNILGVDIPSFIIPVREGRSMGVIVESAVANFRLTEQGYNSAKEFENRVYQYIQSQNKGE